MAIPRVFHQIWINATSPDLPPVYARYRDSWLAHHPGWDYRLWNLDNLPFVSRHQALYPRCGSYAQMADILRYELLFELGGVYLDTDFECLKPIDRILEGVRTFSCSEDGASVSIGIMGAEPASPLMHRCTKHIPSRLGLQSPTAETGPAYFTRQILEGGFNNDLTLFPRAWFYPYNWNEPHRANESFPEAYGIHRWAHSWKDSNTGLVTKITRRLRRLVTA